VNNGHLKAIAKGLANRAAHQVSILEIAQAGEFSVYDIPLDRSVARRELRDLCEDFSLIGELTTLPRIVRGNTITRGTMVYRLGPPRIMRQSWINSNNGIRLGCYYPRVGM
jgi:hypothetical protein